MNQSILTELLKQLLKELNPAYTGNPGTHEYQTLMKPLLDRFGSDPLMPSPSEFVRSGLQAAFPDMATGILDANADIVGIPMEVLLEVVRRELRVTQLTSSLAFAEQLTTDEVEALLTSTRIERVRGKYAIVKVRLYFSTPRFVSIPLNSIAFTADGKEFSVQDYFEFQPEEMADNREDGLYYVEAYFVSTSTGKRYNIPPDTIKGVSNVPGLVTATNKFDGEYGDDDETIADYLDRVRAEVSERAPSTKRGISKMVEDVMGVFEVHSVGKGDAYMTRDSARWQLDTDEVKISLFSGTAGTYVLDPVINTPILERPWTNRITGLSPAIPVMAPPPTHIVLEGHEYEIVAGTFDDGLPVTAVSFYNYLVKIDKASMGNETGYAIAGGATAAHSIGISLVPSWLPSLGGDDLWVVAQGQFTVDPPSLDVIDLTATYGVYGGTGYAFKVQNVTVGAGYVTLDLCDPPTVLRRSYNQTYALRFTSAPGGVVSSIEMGTYDPSGPTFTAIDWQGNPEVPLATTLYMTVEFDLGGGGGAETMFLELTYDGVTMSGAVGTALIGSFINAATFDDAAHFPAGTHTLIGSGDVWSLYTCDYYITIPDNSFFASVIEQLGDYLLPYQSGSHSWSVRRSVIGEDIKGSLLLPSGDLMDTEGDIPMGGCTDVYLYSPPSTGRTIQLQDFPDLDVVMEDTDLGWDDGGGPDPTRLVTIPGGAGLVNVGDVLFVDHATQGGSFIVIGSLDPALDLFVVSGDGFTGVVNNVTYSVHRLMRASLSESTKVVHAGVDAKTSLIARVGFTGALPAVVEEDQTLRLLTGVSAGDYTVGTVGTDWVDVDRVTVGVESGLSYQFLQNYPHPNLPLLNVEQVRVLTPYESPAAPGGDPTGLNLYYRTPVRVEALSNSISNGPGTRIATSDGNTGDVTVSGTLTSRGYVGTLEWTGKDFRDYDCQTGDVLILDGTYISGNFYITDLDDDGAGNGTAEFIYIGTNRAFVMQAENGVGFGVYARNYANIRLYFEHAMYAEIGRVLPRFELIPAGDERLIAGLTTFTSSGTTYTVNAIDEQLHQPAVDAGFLVMAVASPEAVFTGPSTDLFSLADEGLLPQDVIKVLTVPLSTGAVLTSTVSVMGTKLEVLVNDSPRTVTFKGTANPIPLDDATGYGGVKQQLEAALPVSVAVTGAHPNLTLTIRSRSKIEILASVAATYLQLPVADNVPAYAGEYEVQGATSGGIFVIPEDVTLHALLPAAPGAEAIIDVYRMGRKLVKPSEMGYAYGFYYMDVEAMSLGGGDDHAVLQSETFDIGGEYVIPGFDLLTDDGLVYSLDELAELRVTPYCPDANGDLQAISDAQFQVAYGTVPAVNLLQRYLTQENYRATSDDTKAKCKPHMRIGVGPIYSTATALDKATLVEVMDNRLARLLAETTLITLGDVLSWLSPYGVTGTTDTRLIVYYQDMDRRRRLLLSSSVTVNKIWHVEADADLLISAT